MGTETTRALDMVIQQFEQTKDRKQLIADIYSIFGEEYASID